MSEVLASQPVTSMPRLNEPAPDFEAATTHGTVRLSDFRDSWLILFSHPADFTPVCTTEFIGFTEIFPELQKRGVELLGLSIDSVPSHIAWGRAIQEKMGVKIPFPIIADLDKAVSTKYGMLQPGASKNETVRAVFVIDPQGILRAMLYYPMTTGRNMQEILRLVDALQTSDQYHVATPANWQPGDKVLVPAPTSVDDVEQNLKAGYEVVDWYLMKKSVG
ncbi:MAG: peroxiredoxin [Chloroflexi bacterium]|jgi:peroxiredoxin (alkyl hydroperoxide reductase subunit C)|nr:peroxiredoxin [Chloroflexota bacterium]